VRAYGKHSAFGVYEDAVVGCPINRSERFDLINLRDRAHGTWYLQLPLTIFRVSMRIYGVFLFVIILNYLKLQRPRRHIAFFNTIGINVKSRKGAPSKQLLVDIVEAGGIVAVGFDSHGLGFYLYYIS